jgi:hypothetical protein
MLVVISILLRSHTALCAPINVLIIANDEEIGVLSDGLAQYPDFGAITVIHWSDPPDASILSSYDAFVITERYRPLTNSIAWGDVAAEFARTGGGVTCGFAYYITDGATTDYGRLQLPENNPFTRGPWLRTNETLGEILIPGHPLMEGVNQLLTYYRYDIKPNTNAVVVANFQGGLPLAGYLEVGAGRVVGIQMHYKLDPLFSNSGDYMQLYRNAIVFSVARPRILNVALDRNDVRVEWQGTAGSTYTLQAATNLSSSVFVDISPAIKLSGAGFVVTNYVDVGGLTNHSARFYRVKQ